MYDMGLYGGPVTGQTWLDMFCSRCPSAADKQCCPKSYVAESYFIAGCITVDKVVGITDHLTSLWLCVERHLKCHMLEVTIDSELSHLGGLDGRVTVMCGHV